MTAFWTWGVRNPALVFAVAGLLAGLAGVAEWAPALVTVVAGSVVADSAHHLARRSRQRARRAEQTLKAGRAIREIRERYREEHAAHRDAA